MFCSQRHSEECDKSSVTTSSPRRRGRSSRPVSSQESSHEDHCASGLGGAVLDADPSHHFAFQARALDIRSDESKSMRRKAFICEAVLEAARVDPMNQGVGWGDHAGSGEVLERLRTRIHLVGDTNSFDATDPATFHFPLAWRNRRKARARAALSTMTITSHASVEMFTLRPPAATEACLTRGGFIWPHREYCGVAHTALLNLPTMSSNSSSTVPRSRIV